LHAFRRAAAVQVDLVVAPALAETGSKTKAAERLGIPRQSLQKMMKRLALGEGPTEDDPNGDGV